MQQVYETDKIRNVVVLGHGGAGKGSGQSDGGLLSESKGGL